MGSMGQGAAVGAPKAASPGVSGVLGLALSILGSEVCLGCFAFLCRPFPSPIRSSNVPEYLGTLSIDETVEKPKVTLVDRYGG